MKSDSTQPTKTDIANTIQALEMCNEVIKQRNQLLENRKSFQELIKIKNNQVQNLEHQLDLARKDSIFTQSIIKLKDANYANLKKDFNVLQKAYRLSRKSRVWILVMGIVVGAGATTLILWR